jgi:hypothetical protein
MFIFAPTPPAYGKCHTLEIRVYSPDLHGCGIVYDKLVVLLIVKVGGFFVPSKNCPILTNRAIKNNLKLK